MTYTYEMRGEEIYRQSFSIIRSEADLARFTPLEERVACRMIHAAGMVELAAHIHFSPDFAQAAEAALQRGAPVLCDARMVSEGITRKRLPADNAVICTLPAKPERRAGSMWRSVAFTIAELAQVFVRSSVVVLMLPDW